LKIESTKGFWGNPKRRKRKKRKRTGDARNIKARRRHRERTGGENEDNSLEGASGSEGKTKQRKWRTGKRRTREKI